MNDQPALLNARRPRIVLALALSWLAGLLPFIVISIVENPSGLDIIGAVINGTIFATLFTVIAWGVSSFLWTVRLLRSLAATGVLCPVLLLVGLTMVVSSEWQYRSEMGARSAGKRSRAFELTRADPGPKRLPLETIFDAGYLLLVLGPLWTPLATRRSSRGEDVEA